MPTAPTRPDEKPEVLDPQARRILDEHDAAADRDVAEEKPSREFLKDLSKDLSKLKPRAPR